MTGHVPLAFAGRGFTCTLSCSTLLQIMTEKETLTLCDLKGHSAAGGGGFLLSGRCCVTVRFLGRYLDSRCCIHIDFLHTVWTYVNIRVNMFMINGLSLSATHHIDDGSMGTIGTFTPQRLCQNLSVEMWKTCHQSLRLLESAVQRDCFGKGRYEVHI